MEDYCRSIVFHKIHIFASILVGNYSKIQRIRTYKFFQTKLLRLLYKKKNGVNWKIRLLRILNRFLLVLIGVCHWCVWPILGLFLVLHA